MSKGFIKFKCPLCPIIHKFPLTCKSKLCPSYRKNILEKLIKETGYSLLFLPPYSPDLNPIEKLWANMKKKLKDIAHNFNTLEEAVTSVLFNKLV